jgi:hypothetical protein
MDQVLNQKPNTLTLPIASIMEESMNRPVSAIHVQLSGDEKASCDVNRVSSLIKSNSVIVAGYS